MAVTRIRRTEEQRIQALEAQIAALKLRAERKKLTRDPALKHVSAALRSIDKALSHSEDAATRQALDEPDQATPQGRVAGVHIGEMGVVVEAWGR